jgi:hypothetical protein
MNIYARNAVRLAEQPWKLLHRWVGFEKKCAGLMTGQPRTHWAFPTIAAQSQGFDAQIFR